MRFHAPEILWLVVPWLALPVAWWLLEKQAQEKLAKFASHKMLGVLVKGVDASRRRWRMAMGLLALLLTIIALARPQLGTREEFVPSQGLDAVFLLDVSNSMLAEDIVPNRLKKAKHLIRNFVDRLSGDRVGVVAFAGSAYPAVPLTTDYEYAKQTLEVLDESSVSNQGSDLKKAIEVGAALLVRGSVNDEDESEAGMDESGRVLIIVSDGESHEGEEAKLAPALKDKGIKVYTIGVGSLKGSPIPLRDQSGYMRGYKKDAAGNMVLTKLETANLEAISTRTGGKYYSASSNEGEIEEIVGQLSTMNRSIGVGRRVIVYDEVYQYPLLLAVILLMGVVFMREARAAALAFGLLCFLTRTDARADDARSVEEYRQTKRGLEAYANKDYGNAVQYFGKAQAANPDAPLNHMNLGDALLRSGSPEGAVSEFKQALASKDANEAARGAFNLGKSWEAAKKPEEALRSYQAGLDRLREDPAKADPEVVLRLKRALEQAEQQKQKQKDQQGGGQGDDRKKEKENDQQDKKDKGDGKDKSGQGQDKQDKKEKTPPQQMARQKPRFKDEKLNEADANRVMQQLQEKEKQTQQRVMRNKTAKPKNDKNEKDW